MAIKLQPQLSLSLHQVIHHARTFCASCSRLVFVSFHRLLSSRLHWLAINVSTYSALIQSGALSPVHTCEPNVRMCGRDCELLLCYLRMVCIQFATNQNLSVFCMNTKEIGLLGVLFSPQVHRKLVYHAPSMNCLVYMCVPAFTYSYMAMHR